MPEVKNTFIQSKMNKDMDGRILPNGHVYFLAHGMIELLNNVTTGEGSGYVISEWLTCDKSKYISERPNTTTKHKG